MRLIGTAKVVVVTCFVSICLHGGSLSSDVPELLRGKSTAVSPEEKPGAVPVVVSWRGETKTALSKMAPDSGFIVDDVEWKALWKAWRGNEPVPSVNFREAMVLVGVNRNFDRINLYPVLDDQGDLRVTSTFGGVGLLGDGGDVRGYQLALIKFDGIKTIQGHEFDARWHLSFACIAATPEQIAAAFGAWLPVAPERETVVYKNPITGKSQSFKRWVPAVDLPKVVGDRTLKSDFAHLPQTRLKRVRLLRDDLKALETIVVGKEIRDAADFLDKPALLHPHGNSPGAAHLRLIPAALTSGLAGIAESEIASIAEAWLTAAEASMSVVDARSTRYRSTADAHALTLRELVRLAKQADESEANLYLWWSPKSHEQRATE